MPFCMNCGKELPDGARFCLNCGTAIGEVKTDTSSYRKTTYEGEIHKCPNCGELLNSFVANCPSCGYELRGTKVSNAVKEFALKLEAIESRREYEKPRGIFAMSEAYHLISKADKQKISLIKNFSVPNTKEDMLEFMILSTSNINMQIYDSTNTSPSKSEKEINAAWFSKVQQVYEKAKRNYSTDNTFNEIQTLYDKCNKEINNSKKKGTMKWILIIGGFLSFYIIIFVLLFHLSASSSEKEEKELERLNNIVIEVQIALNNKDYTYALKIADSIDYQRYDTDMERKWDTEREYWVDKVIEEAEKEGVELEYTPTSDIDKANDEEN